MKIYLVYFTNVIDLIVNGSSMYVIFDLVMCNQNIITGPSSKTTDFSNHSVRQS